jgi:hypothetical protein
MERTILLTTSPNVSSSPRAPFNCLLRHCTDRFTGTISALARPKSAEGQEGAEGGEN